MDITTNRVDAMNHYGIAREAATIYGIRQKGGLLRPNGDQACRSIVPHFH